MDIDFHAVFLPDEALAEVFRRIASKLSSCRSIFSDSSLILLMPMSMDKSFLLVDEMRRTQNLSLNLMHLSKDLPKLSKQPSTNYKTCATRRQPLSPGI